ncbi:MAG: Hpt domain-containing protein [Deltaproteobacteria bacterium]|nr:Hpt domain-containing protein [Deltaproteobacteria bacterium]
MQTETQVFPLRLYQVALTATEDIKERCLDASMDDYGTKLLRKVDFLATIDEWAMSRSVFKQGVAPSLDESASKSSRYSSIDTDDIPMDFDRALDEFEGDKEFLMVIIDGFLEHAGNQIDSIRRALFDGDSEVVMGEAHSMRGSAAALMADKVFGIAYELETIGESGLLERGGDVLTTLEKEFHRLKGYVQDI